MNTSPARGHDRTAEADRAIGNGAVRATEVLHRPQRNLPADRSLLQIDSHQRAPRRRVAWQIRRRLQEAAHHRVGRSRLPSKFAVVRVVLQLLPWDQPHPRGKVVDVHDQ